MKESISYSFLLNIIILFIFVCAAIVTGVFSYYRAFRAGTMIVNEIEKFEGYNCVAAQSISQKMSGVSYNLPFDAKCKDSETNCITDEGKNYKVYSYELDASSSESSTSVEKIKIGDSSYDGASSISCDGNICEMSSKYQYGVYTYMYVNLPILSGLIRIPVYNKTRVMVDQRSLFSTNIDGKTYVFDRDVLPLEYIQNYSSYYEKYVKLKEKKEEEVDVSSTTNYAGAIKMFATQKVLKNYNAKQSGQKYFNDDLKTYGYGIRLNDKYLKSESNLRELFKSSEANVQNSQSLYDSLKKECGTVVDWSLF